VVGSTTGPTGAPAGARHHAKMAEVEEVDLTNEPDEPAAAAAAPSAPQSPPPDGMSTAGGAGDADDAAPQPAGRKRRSSQGAKKAKRQSIGARAELTLAGEDGTETVSVKRSVRIQALESQRMKDEMQAKLGREKQQQQVLHMRIASLLKKVEYMDKKRQAAEDKLGEAKVQARTAKTDSTSSNVKHLTDLNAKDKEIAQLKKVVRKLESAGTKPKASPREKKKEAGAAAGAAAAAAAEQAVATASAAAAKTIVGLEKQLSQVVTSSKKEAAGHQKSLKAAESRLQSTAEKLTQQIAATKAAKAQCRELHAEASSLKKQIAQAARAAAVASELAASEKKAAAEAAAQPLVPSAPVEDDAAVALRAEVHKLQQQVRPWPLAEGYQSELLVIERAQP
jgi:hypothetical protein